MKLQIKVDADGNITETKFKTFGCGSAIASSSVATEWLKGKNIEDGLSIKNTDIASHLKLPPVKLHCRCVVPRVLFHGGVCVRSRAGPRRAQHARRGRGQGGDQRLPKEAGDGPDRGERVRSGRRVAGMGAPGLSLVTHS